MKNTKIINRTKSLIQIIIENNIRNTKFMNEFEGQIFESDIQNWEGRYFSISTSFKELIEQEITSIGCKIIKERENTFLIFLGEDIQLQEQKRKLTLFELKEIFSIDATKC